MILIPYSYNGTSLQSTDYVASFPKTATQSQISVNSTYVPRAGAVPVFAGKDFQPMTLTLEVLMQHDTMTTLSSLNTLFDTKDETPRQFICTDSENSNKQWYVYATPKQVNGGGSLGNMAIVQLSLDDPIWQSVTQNSQTFSITSATDSTSVTAGGNDESYPIFEITPTSSPSTDFLYQLYIQVLPTSTDPVPNRPLCITSDTSGATFDTAALVSGGKMQADGDDLRVYRNGIEVDRWLSGINTTDTKVWVVEDMPGALNMTLKTALASTDTITEIELNYTTANLQSIQGCPESGRLIVDTSLGSTDSEEFIYSARTITSTKLAFTIEARQVRNTSAFSHAANDNVRLEPFDYNIIYGNSTVSAPVVDDTNKPIITLSTSSNVTWVYANFYDVNALRAGIWTPVIQAVASPQLTRSDYFTSTNDAGDTDPATATGIKILSYEDVGVWKTETATIFWEKIFPELVTSVSGSGEQSQNSVSWPATTLRAKSTISTSPFHATAYTVAAQVTTDYATWTTFTFATSDVTLPATTYSLRFAMSGSVVSTTDNYAKAALNAITVNVTNNPHILMRTEATNYQLNCRIGNETTGEYFDVIHPMANNETLIIDTDPDFPTAKHKGIIVNGAVKPSTIRAKWLRLQSGANTITFQSNLAATSNITNVIKWRDRANFF